MIFPILSKKLRDGLELFSSGMEVESMADRRTVIDKLRRWMESTKGDAYQARNTPLVLSLEELNLLERRRENE